MANGGRHTKKVAAMAKRAGVKRVTPKVMAKKAAKKMATKKR